MKLRAITRMAGSIQANPGDTIDVTREQAKALLAGGFAAEISYDELADALEGEVRQLEEIHNATEAGGTDGPDVGQRAGGRTAQPRRSKKTG